MNKPGYCSTCNRLSTLKDGLCAKCRIPVKGERSDTRKLVKELVRTAISKKRTVTGEKAVFDKIIAERPHICFITGTAIRNPSPSNCAHVLNKKNHKAWLLNPKNIVLLQTWVHNTIDQGTLAAKEKLHEYPGYAKYLELFEKLKAEYSLLSLDQIKEMIAANKQGR